jgi:osmotically-inducible protein OsmY
MMSNDELRTTVEDELYWEPRVDSEAIAVAADDGTVTLRGTVGSFREKRDATSAAKRVYGVKDVDNELQVRLLDSDRRDDADLRGAVLQALMLDGLVPGTVDVKVDDGIVTLTGSAAYQFERDEAERVAGNLVGVLWVENDIDLTAPPARAADVRQEIQKALARDAKLDAQGLTVETSGGTVTLSGMVSSWAEHDSAIAAAWAAPGVSSVKDELFVDY